MVTIGSRDLSATLSGELEVTIEEVGTFVASYDQPARLAQYVATCALMLTGQFIRISSYSNSPWEVVSFDPEARKLQVKAVKLTN